MSTILVNNIKSYTGSTVTISGSNISVTGNTTLGDGAGGDTITITGNITASGDISASGTVFADRFHSATGGAAIDFNDSVEVEGNISASGDITASNLQIDGDIIHGGDADTKIALTTDTMNFTVGGETMITLDENESGGGSNQDEIFFNPNGNDVNFRVAGANSTLIYTSASSDVMAIGTQVLPDLNARLTVSGNLHVHEGNITASGAITAEHFLSTDDAVITDDLTVGGDVTGSLTTTASFGKLELDSENLLINNGFQKVLISGSIISTASFGQLLVAPDGGQDDQLTINAVGTVSGSHTSTGSFGHIISDSDIEGTLSSATQTNITALGVLTSLSSSGTITALNFNATGSEGNITASGNITSLGTITAEHFLSTDDAVITDDLLVGGNVSGSITSTGSFGDLKVGDSSINGLQLYVNLDNTGTVSGSQLSTGSFGELIASGHSLKTNMTPNTTTGIISGSSISTASFAQVEAEKVIFDNNTIASVDDPHCGSVTGTKFTVQNQLQAAIADGDTSALFTVGNEFINTDSVIMGNLNGVTTLLGGLSQSSLNIHVNANNSMSFCFVDGEGGETIADDTPFTASFVIL